MSISDLYDSINAYSDLSHNKMYHKLLESYSKARVQFVMYDLFEYEHDSSDDELSREEASKKELENRKDDIFRKNVKERYNNECIISGTDMACDVCHLIPFSKSTKKEKYDVNNGIVLRSDIHTLFDTGDIKINPDTMMVELSEKILNSKKQKEYHKYNGIKLDIHAKSIPYLRRVYTGDV